MDFGREVRRRRKALDLTIEQLAERARITPNYLGSIETGGRDPSLSTVLSIASALRVPIGELLADRADGFGPVGAEAARLIESAPQDVREAALRMLRAIVRRRR